MLNVGIAGGFIRVKPLLLRFLRKVMLYQALARTLLTPFVMFLPKYVDLYVPTTLKTLFRVMCKCYSMELVCPLIFSSMEIEKNTFS